MIEEYWNDALIYMVVYKEMSDSNISEMEIKESSEMFIFDVNVSPNEIKGRIMDKYPYITEIIQIDEYAEGLELKEPTI